MFLISWLKTKKFVVIFMSYDLNGK